LGMGRRKLQIPPGVSDFHVQSRTRR
jgi:hypothetical protein